MTLNEKALEAAAKQLFAHDVSNRAGINAPAIIALCEDAASKVVSAYLSALTVTTVEELDALGFEAVVIDPCGTPAVCQRSGPGFNEWARGGSGALIDSETLLMSGTACTVLHLGSGA